MILELIESKYVKTLLGSVNSTGNGSVVIKKGGAGNANNLVVL